MAQIGREMCVPHSDNKSEGRWCIFKQLNLGGDDNCYYCKSRIFLTAV